MKVLSANNTGSTPVKDALAIEEAISVHTNGHEAPRYLPYDVCSGRSDAMTASLCVACICAENSKHRYESWNYQGLQSALFPFHDSVPVR